MRVGTNAVMALPRSHWISLHWTVALIAVGVVAWKIIGDLAGHVAAVSIVGAFLVVAFFQSPSARESQQQRSALPLSCARAPQATSGPLAAEVTRLRQEKAEAETRLEQVLHENSGRRGQEMALRTMCERAQAETAALNAVYLESQAQVTSLEATIAEHTNKLEQSKKAKRRVEEELEEEQKLCRSFRLRLTEVQSEGKRLAELDRVAAEQRGKATQAEAAKEKCESQLAEARKREQESSRSKGEAQAEAERASAKAAKLATQLKELQAQHKEAKTRGDEMERKCGTLEQDLQRRTTELEKDRVAHRKMSKAEESLSQERLRAEKLENELAVERRERRVLQRELQRLQGGGAANGGGNTGGNGAANNGHGALHRRNTAPNLGEGSNIQDEATMDALGELLQRSIRGVPDDKRAQVKKQLLLCFHPDKNPHTDLAHRVTQMLNTTD